MKYNFDQVIDRMGTDSIKWEKQTKFGKPSGGLLPFWIADTDFATLPEAVDAMKLRMQHPLFGYTTTTEKTLRAVQGWYQRRHDVSLPIEAFSASEGVVTSIWFSIRAFTKPGDGVLVFTPVYDPFFHAIETQDRRRIECPLMYKEEHYQIDWTLFETELKQGVKAVIFCNPHNPVSRIWTSEEVERLVTLCKAYDVWLLSDEVHGDIELYDYKYVSVLKYKDLYDKMLVYTAISKTFNMAGLHSSCTIAPNPEYRKAQENCLKEAWLMSPNALANSAIEACYTYGDQWVDELNAYLTQNAEYLLNYCHEKIPSVHPVKPEGTYLMWLDISRLPVNSDTAVRILADQYGIAVGGGACYSGNGEHFLRFNIGCPRVTLQKGLEQLGKFVREL